MGRDGTFSGGGGGGMFGNIGAALDAQTGDGGGGGGGGGGGACALSDSEKQALQEIEQRDLEQDKILEKIRLAIGVIGKNAELINEEIKKQNEGLDNLDKRG